MVKRNVTVLLLIVAGFTMYGMPVHAGSLEPSAGPGPTMKTLDEVEPRIPISQTNIPLTIATPGSYYLTEDVTATGTAITINVNDVTLDLSGFSLAGPASGAINYGIYMAGRRNVEIRNGTVRGFYFGIFEGNTGAQGHRVIDVRAYSNDYSGIFLNGSGHLVKDCTSHDNGNSASASGSVYSISVGPGGIVTGNTVFNNGTLATTSVYGISAGFGSTVTNNTSYNNGNSSTGNNVRGIDTFSGCTVIGNTVYGNGNSASGSVYGLLASSGCTVARNSAYDNGKFATGSRVRGIYAYIGCTVIGNTAYSNGTSASGTVYGIYLGGNNLVDQNTAYGNNGTNMNSPSSSTFGLNHAP